MRRADGLFRTASTFPDYFITTAFTDPIATTISTPTFLRIHVLFRRGTGTGDGYVLRRS